VALTIRPVSSGTRSLVQKIVDVTFSSSYPALGEVITPANYEMTKVLFVAAAASASGLQPYFDTTNNTLRLLETGSATSGPFLEVGTGSNQSAVTVRLLVVGYV
jgi:hypothetical protein